MNRQLWVFAIVGLLAATLVAGPVSSSAETPALRISLEQRFGRAMFRSCDLTIEVVERLARSVLRCVWNIAPASDLMSQRTLTSQETQRLLALTTGNDILSGTASGKDLASTDGVTETVTIQRGTEITVLVASGNPSFETGSRRELLNFLHSIIEDLQRTATR